MFDINHSVMISYLLYLDIDDIDIPILERTDTIEHLV